MIRVSNHLGVIEIPDHLKKLYLRNGYELVKDEPKAEEQPIKAEPKKRTAKKSTKK
jgi:hypothetical protein